MSYKFNVGLEIFGTSSKPPKGYSSYKKFTFESEPSIGDGVEIDNKIYNIRRKIWKFENKKYIKIYVLDIHSISVREVREFWKKLHNIKE